MTNSPSSERADEHEVATNASFSDFSQRVVLKRERVGILRRHAVASLDRKREPLIVLLVATAAISQAVGF